MNGFVKLDCNSINSSLWADRDAKDIFLTALCMAMPIDLSNPTEILDVRTMKKTGEFLQPGEYGIIRAACSAIIRNAYVEKDKGMNALERLSSPDNESKSSKLEGRRLVRIDGGFIAINYADYRNKDYTAAERMRRYRAKSVTGVTRNRRNATRNVTQAEAEAEAESTSNVLVLLGDKEGVQGEMMKDVQDKPAPASGKSKKKVQIAEEIITEFENDATYDGINVRNQWGRMAAWCRTNHKHPTKRRFINWLHRVDVPIKGESEPQMSAMNSACSNRYAVKDYKITDKKPNAKNGTTAYQPTHQPSNSANGSSFY